MAKKRRKHGMDEGLKRMFTIQKMDGKGNWQDETQARIVRIKDPQGRSIDVLADREGAGFTIRLQTEEMAPMMILPDCANTVRIEPRPKG